MKKTTFVLDHEDLVDVLELKDAEAGKLFKAILSYVDTGQAAKLPSRADVIFGFIRRRLDKDRIKYEEVCRKRSESGKLGGRKTQEQKQANACKREANQADIDIDTDTDLELDTELDTELDSEPEREPVPPGQGTPAETEERLSFGSYGWIRLTRQEHDTLEAELGLTELNRCIRYVDELAQSTGNKNRWQDWALVLSRCSREGWGCRGKKESIPYGCGELGEAELEAVRRIINGD